MKKKTKAEIMEKKLLEIENIKDKISRLRDDLRVRIDDLEAIEDSLLEADVNLEQGLDIIYRAIDDISGYL